MILSSLYIANTGDPTCWIQTTVSGIKWHRRSPANLQNHTDQRFRYKRVVTFVNITYYIHALSWLLCVSQHVCACKYVLIKTIQRKNCKNYKLIDSYSNHTNNALVRKCDYTWSSYRRFRVVGPNWFEKACLTFLYRFGDFLNDNNIELV